MTYLWIATSVISLYSIIVTFYCVKFALIVLRVQDSIQESVDIIDEKYSNISEILQIPIFYDSPEVRQVLRDLEETRDSLHQVAYDMSAKLVNEEQNENEKDL